MLAALKPNDLRTIDILNGTAEAPPVAEAVRLVDALEEDGAFLLGEAPCRMLRADRPAVSPDLPEAERRA